MTTSARRIWVNKVDKEEKPGEIPAFYMQYDLHGGRGKRQQRDGRRIKQAEEEGGIIIIGRSEAGRDIQAGARYPAHPAECVAAGQYTVARESGRGNEQRPQKRQTD